MAIIDVQRHYPRPSVFVLPKRKRAQATGRSGVEQGTKPRG